MPTIRDVARKAGVSVATVSRVINNKGKIADDTKKTVLEAIDELSYKPNIVARGLSTRRSYAVAFILPTITNPFFPEMAKAVEDVARENGYKVLLCNTDDRRDILKDYLHTLGSQYIDGIIINSLNLVKEDLEELSQMGIPVVMMDRVLEDQNFTSITVNNREGGRMATEHLLDVGCKRVAHISGLETDFNAQYRLWGYRDIVSEKPWFDPSWIGQAEFSVQSGYEVAKEIFTRHNDVDGIFCSNDLIAIGALKAASEWGKSVPNDLAIVGFDGIGMSGLTIPGITTIQQLVYYMGELAMKELLKKIEEKDAEAKHYELGVELVLRESTMRPRE